MNRDDIKDHLLQNYPSDEGSTAPILHPKTYAFAIWWPLTITLLVLSIAMNLYLTITEISVGSKKMFPMDELATQRSPYTDLRYELPIEYKLKTEYTSDNMTLADQMWESLDVDSVLIAVTPEWADNKGLPDSKPFLWDKTKRIYYIKVFHQLHCLKAIRKTLHDFISTNSTLVPLKHVEHCLDILRQDLMCKADDTPMIATPDGAGSNQTMQCKDLSKLRAWVQAPAQHSCYRHLDNYVNLSHPDERYAFCPEDSPYYPTMQEWFKKHGHHDPFQE